MVPETYGSILRKARETAGFSIEEVIEQLSMLGYKISTKTLYGYENDVSSPKISLFMTLCHLYNLNDLYATFNLRAPTETPRLELSPHEKNVIVAYRANPAMQNAVDRLLGVEDAAAQEKQA